MHVYKPPCNHNLTVILFLIIVLDHSFRYCPP